MQKIFQQMDVEIIFNFLCFYEKKYQHLCRIFARHSTNKIKYEF